jgi:putative ABC transport system permease protein
MRLRRVIAHRLRSLLFRSREEAELEQEIDLHVEQLVKELRAEGMSEADARLEARRQFGPDALTREQCRDKRRVNLIDELTQDAGYALRLFRRSPAFTFTAIASLALGIGANTAIFQLFDAVRLRPLPVERPGELVAIRIRGEGRSGNFRGRNSQLTNAVWEEIKRRQTSFAGVFAYGDTPVNLAPVGEMRNVEGVWVSGSYFPVLGVKPHLGRLLGPDDDRPGCGHPGVVISHAFWQREFSGDPNVTAKTLPIDGRPVPILGVTPPEFFGAEVGRRFDVAMPICSNAPSALNNRLFWFLTAMARLKPDTSPQVAREQLAAISPVVFEATTPPYSPAEQALFNKMRLDIESGSRGQSTLPGVYTTSLTLLLGMVGLVLLVACANLANMLLARATAREHEFAVRVSLGASRGRIIRQLLLEGLMLAAAGAALGAALAPTISQAAVRALSTPRDPIYLTIGGGWHVLAFTAGAAILATLLFGLAPALHAARASARGATASRRTFAFRRALLLAQVALCTALLGGALLFAQSFTNLLKADLGFRADGVLVVNTFFSERRYPVARRLQAYDDLHRRLASIPGVTGVARGYVIPISGSGWDRAARRSPTDPPHEVNLSSISEDYFRVMNTPLLAGRDFNANDRTGSPPVAIVNQAVANTFFNGQNPVGQTFKIDGPEPPFEIVGLAANAKYSNVQEEFGPIIYFPTRQEESPRLTVRYIVRASGTPESLIRPVTQTIAGVDPQLSMRFVVLRQQIAESLLGERLMASLAGAFGALAGMLALMGVYGVTSYVVERRRREFGIRIALGSTRGGIVRMVLGQVAAILAGGVAGGVLLAIAGGKTAATVLFGVKPYDAAVLAPAAILVAIAGLAAGLLPAVKASRTAPGDCLRE